MDFDISKLATDQSKVTGTKAKPRFGPAVRARPKPQAKPAEVPPADKLASEAQPNEDNIATQLHKQATDGDEQGTTPATESAAFSAHKSAVTDGAAGGPTADTPPSEQADNAGRRFKPAAGKRKAPEVPEALDAAEPGNEVPAGDTMTVVFADGDPAVDPEPSTGPMTKAKRRKGMGKGTGAAPHKPKTPLAEQAIDPHTMPMKTIIKCAMAKDRVKANAEQAARAAAGQGQGSANRQQPSRPVQPEPSSAGAPQMILDEETGTLVLDQSSLTMQAQPREEYLRREDGHHDTVNSMSYMKRESTARWSPEETEEFYAALQMWGTNFNYVACTINTRMAALGLPCKNRSRKQVKLKYNREEKANPKKVTRAVQGQRAAHEDYDEIIQDFQAAQGLVQENDSTYLEAAPSGAAEARESMGNEANAAPQAAAFGPEHMSASGELGLQAAAQPGIIPAAGGPLRGRPRAKPRPRANTSAQQSAPLVDGQMADGDAHMQQQQEAVPGQTQDRFTRMLQESGANAEDWADEGGY